MVNKEKISIIVPIYNVEAVLVNCINSIINQTYSNLEIILVDDGSKDNSGKICEDFSRKDDRIKVYHKPNGGLSDARNYGLDRATGEYISFVDADDYIISNFYEYLVDLMKRERDIDIAQASFVRIDIDDIERCEEILKDCNLKTKEILKVNTNIEALEKLYGSNLNEYLDFIVVWNKLYKKELFDNIRFPVGKVHEDEYTTYKILYNVKKMIESNIKIYGYIQTKKSIMRNKITQKRVDDTLNAYLELIKFCEESKELEIEAKARRRYLEYCIELSNKIQKQEDNSEEDIERIKILNRYFKEFYERYIKFIELNTKNSKEMEIIEELNIYYNKIKGLIN